MAVVIVARRRHRQDRQQRERHSFWNAQRKNNRDTLVTWRCHFGASLWSRSWFGSSHKEESCSACYGKTSGDFALSCVWFFPAHSGHELWHLSERFFQYVVPGVKCPVPSDGPIHYISTHMGHTLNEAKHVFFAVAGFLKSIGATDCTHVQLVSPSDREHIYRNRKHTHSLNVQVVCDSKGIITNIVAKYPCSVHDSFILRNSALFSNLGDGEYGDNWLLGELIPWML